VAEEIKPTLIIDAAVQYNGRVYIGKRHVVIMRQIWEEAGEEIHISQLDQGFLTSGGKFVNRFQAGVIAFRAGQTKTRKQELLSEDVW
jgi:hypothetical protein